MKRDDEGEIIAFERGDVVWGVDPFKQDIGVDTERTMNLGGVSPRPWLVISSESVPFHPEQYLCVTLSTKSWHDESIPLEAEDWLVGGAPRSSSLLPWSVSALRQDYLDTTGELVARLGEFSDETAPDSGFQGRLRSAVVDSVVRRLIGYLETDLRE